MRTAREATTGAEASVSLRTLNAALKRRFSTVLPASVFGYAQFLVGEV
jgi:hypothetical protein